MKSASASIVALADPPDITIQLPEFEELKTLPTETPLEPEMPAESPPIRDAKSLETELDKFPHLREHPKFEKLRAHCAIYFHALEFKNAYEHDEVTLVHIAKEVGTSDTQVGRWLIKEREPRLLWHLNHERVQATTREHFHHTDTHKNIPKDPILHAANDPQYRKHILPPPEFTPKNIERLLQLQSEQDKNLALTQLTTITSYPMYEEALRAFPLIQTLPNFDQLHKHVHLYYNIKNNLLRKADGKLPIGALCKHYSITKSCIHNWLNDSTQPQLQTILEQRAQTLQDYQVKLHDLRQLDNDIITLHDLNNRLSPTHFHFWKHITTDPAFDHQLTDATRYLAILQLVEHDHHPTDLDRHFHLHKDYTGDTLRYHHRPHLIQLATTIPQNPPKPNHRWLPTTTNHTNYPTRYINAPYTITNWQQLPPLLNQLPTLHHPDQHLKHQLNNFKLNHHTLHQWTQKYGPINSPNDRLLAFAYLIGTSLSDGWIQQQSTLSSSFGLELSKKYDWAQTFGNRTAYYWTSLGFPTKSGKGYPPSNSRPHGTLNWYSVTTPFLTYFNETVLGFQSGETHTYTPAKINYILHAPSKFQIKVLQGFFDGDGWAAKHGREIGIHSHQNRTIIKELLRLHGIIAKKTGDYELRIHSRDNISKAAKLPLFLSATGKQKRIK